MDLKGKKINFLGDSITEGHGCTSPETAFPGLIAKNYGAICRNYGIGGTRIARQSTPSENPVLDLDFMGRVAEMDEDADIIVVFGGTNDYGHGDAPLGRMEDRTPYTFYGALHTLYRSLIEKYPGDRIAVITPLHRLREDNPFGKGEKKFAAGTLRDYVAAIREVAEYYSLPLLDLYASSGLQPAVPVIMEKYIPDGLHPNDAGHLLLTYMIAHFLMGL